MFWGCWKHVFGIPGARPMYLKADLHKESKNEFKTISARPPSVMIFSKYCLQSKKIIIKIGRFVDFWIFMAIYMNKLDQFKKINCRTFRISWNITKMLKTEQFFHMFSCYYSFNRLFRTSNTWFSKIKSHIWKNWSIFNILVIFQLILKVLQLNFF